ncbi:MAG: hypothetical protein DRG39_01635 [Deltaproteobacteria bacterium]|nr:MAG: hypothetical protein DRG39_01635 [Deltaproteobacteria bacterium]
MGDDLDKVKAVEHIKIRCPRLGHEVDFKYCRRENLGLPCHRTLICWSGYFDVESFLKKELSSEEWEKVFETPQKPKMLSLLELIEQAKSKKTRE